VRAIVVDASFALEVVHADAVLIGEWESWIRAGAQVLVPAHFGHEVANALLHGMSPRSASHASILLGSLFALGVEVADRGLRGLEGALRLAERHRLTVYDGAYLDLAIDIDGDMATLDRALARAAVAEGLSVIG
jgi:predicted nucleic acid-binding protein